jgi:hypothetical protein
MDFNRLLDDYAAPNATGGSSTGADGGVPSQGLSATLAQFHYSASASATATDARRAERRGRPGKKATRTSGGDKQLQEHDEDEKSGDEDNVTDAFVATPALAASGAATMSVTSRAPNAAQRRFMDAATAARVAYRSLCGVMHRHMCRTGQHGRRQPFDLMRGSEAAADAAVLDAVDGAAVRVASALPALLRARRAELANVRAFVLGEKRVYEVVTVAKHNAPDAWAAVTRPSGAPNVSSDEHFKTVRIHAQMTTDDAAAAVRARAYQLSLGGGLDSAESRAIVARCFARKAPTLSTMPSSGSVMAAEGSAPVNVFGGDEAALAKQRAAAARLLATSSDDEDD